MLLAALGVSLVMIVVTRRVRPAALLVAGLVLGMAPVAVRNIVVAHEWSLVSSHGGLNFYIGNSAGATGFYQNVPGITPTIAGQEQDTRRVAGRALGHPVTDEGPRAISSGSGERGSRNTRATRYRSSRGNSGTRFTPRTCHCPTAIRSMSSTLTLLSASMRSGRGC